MPDKIGAFVERWSGTDAGERANKDAFLIELCRALGVPGPDPKTGDPERDNYVFERDVVVPHQGRKHSVGFIDLYKQGCFILEAKQGSSPGAKKRGSARRGTNGWTIAMQQEAYGQALKYARSFLQPPPFIIVCDIGYCFDFYACFDGSGIYSQFPDGGRFRLFFADLPRDEPGLQRLRLAFSDPLALDPARQAARVTHDVARHLAVLAQRLEKKHDPHEVALFLMRCIFTMFAEDVGLLPERLFTDAIQKIWIPNPGAFPAGIESLWQSMNEGKPFGFVGKLLRFNGGLFAQPSALPLDKDGLQDLWEAAICHWGSVEPSIFGTLLEQALHPEERHRLGAHYTPRSYVERLVRPTLEEPLRADWQIAQAQVRQALGPRAEPTEKDRKKAVKILKDFHRSLSSIHVLDPACGTGNFLYVALDLFKRIEGEVLSMLQGLGEKQSFLDLDSVSVSPAQFLGIELNSRAKEIAELVLWIGYLQWQRRTYGKERLQNLPEPVLRRYKNIDNRDALLDHSGETPVLDALGKPVTRWDGKSLRLNPATNQEIPDESRRVTLYHYPDPRPASWPGATFIIGNPPFLGTKRMKAALGDGYVDALRSVYAGQVEDNADYVMYWWHKAACLLESPPEKGSKKAPAERLRAFGFITTNSISQSFNRRVLRRHLDAGTRLTWAIPDHPWVDSESGAAVRIAMTVASSLSPRGASLLRVVRELQPPSAEGAAEVELSSSSFDLLHEDLRGGANVARATPLRSNSGISGMGIARHGDGFVLEPAEAASLRLRPDDPTIRPYLGGRDLLQRPRERYIIDFSFLSEDEARSANPAAFQRLVERVLPERSLNRRDSIRKLWWRFGWERPLLRRSLLGLPRFIATTETAKHRIFQFIDGAILPDHKMVAISSRDAFLLGVLSSRIHLVWALATGARLEDRPVYTKKVCFDPFPFPDAASEIRKNIREKAESLDAFRKERQAQHPGLTLTGMYNVAQKLRGQEALTKSEQEVQAQGLVSVLVRMHDELDAAVFEAYGWPTNLGDEGILERLVALNDERAEEERGGRIRWLRPDYQNPTGQQTEAQEGANDEEEEAAAPGAYKSWPKKLAEQIAAVRDLLLGSSSSWTATQVANAFRGADPAGVRGILESLEVLGLLFRFEIGGQDQWKAARPEPAATAPRPDPRVTPEQTFWEHFGDRIQQRAARAHGGQIDVLVAPAPLRPDRVKTAMNEGVEGAPDFPESHVFFVDLSPYANWAHPCAYVFVADDGRASWCDDRWPPADLEQFSRVSRP